MFRGLNLVKFRKGLESLFLSKHLQVLIFLRLELISNILFILDSEFNKVSQSISRKNIMDL